MVMQWQEAVKKNGGVSKGTVRFYQSRSYPAVPSAL